MSYELAVKLYYCPKCKGKFYEEEDKQIFKCYKCKYTIGISYWREKCKDEVNGERISRKENRRNKFRYERP